MANNPITPTKVNFATGDVLTAQQMDDFASALNRVEAFTSTATAAGTTTLTVASNKLQIFTGSTTQTVVLPVTSTLGLGMAFVIQNESSGIVTVQSSGANTIYAVPAGATATFTCILLTGTTAASWAFRWEGATAAPAGAEVVIAQYVCASPQSIITFSSIPATYTNLRVELEARGTTAATSDTLAMRINGDGAGNYDFETITGNASASVTAEAFAAISLYAVKVAASTAGAGLSGNAVIRFINYARTAFNKTVISTGGYKIGTSSGGLFMYLLQGFWRNTAAINQITFQTVSGGNIDTGSVFTLYGEM